MSRIYVLARGKEYVSLPTRKSRSQLMVRARKVIQQTHNLWHNNQALWHPGLELSTDINLAWTTNSLFIARDRQRILASLPSGWVTTIKALR